MKNIIRKSKFFLPLCLVMFFVALLSSCKTHVHSWKEEFVTDKTHHWHECVDENCEILSEKEAHKGGTATCTSKAKCEVCGVEYGELGQHIFGTTYVSDGTSHWKVCTLCNATDTKESHKGGIATCTSKAKCEVCNEEYGELAKHTLVTTYSHDKTSHWNECSVCHSKENVEAHKGGTATCTSLAKCEACNELYGSFLSHDYNSEEWGYKEVDGHAHICKNCTHHTEILAHTPNIAAATEEQAKVCTECSYIIEPKLNHTHKWSTTLTAGSEKHYYTCSGCSEKKDEVEHDYSTSLKDITHHWSKCVCGKETSKVAHTYTISGMEEYETPLPTGEIGEIIAKCSCQEEIKINVKQSDFVSIDDMVVIDVNGVPHLSLPLKEETKAKLLEDYPSLNAESVANAAYSAPFERFEIEIIAVVDGKLVWISDLAVEGGADKHIFEIELKQGSEMTVYHGSLGAFKVMEGIETTYTVENEGIYKVYVNSSYQVWPNRISALPYDEYSLKVDGKELNITDKTDSSGFAKYDVVLAVGDVLKVMGDETVLKEFTAEVAGVHRILVNYENEVTVTDPTVLFQELTVYYFNDLYWNEVSVYGWVTEGPFGSWPGNVMEPIEGKDGWFEATFEAESFDGLQIIFNNNGKGQQTNDIPVDIEGGAVYFYGTCVDGFTSFEDVEAEAGPYSYDYYLVGSMNAWLTEPAYKFTVNPADNEEYVLKDVILEEDSLLKIRDVGNINYGFETLKTNPNYLETLIVGEDDGFGGFNIRITKAGTYTIYFDTTPDVDGKRIWIEHHHIYNQDVVDQKYKASDADCTNKATYYKSCVCGISGTEDTFEDGEALGHTGGTATCVKKAICDVCEQPYGELSNEHEIDEEIWEKSSEGHWHKCSVVGCTYTTEVTKHIEGLAATETTPQLCTVCGFELNPVTGHINANPKDEWSFNDTHHWYGCKGCESAAHETSKGEHTSTENNVATCTTKAVCDVCDKEYGNVLKHNYEWKENQTQDGHYQECSRCNDIINEAEHSFIAENDENKHWEECACGKKQSEVNHSFVAKEITATEGNDPVVTLHTLCSCNKEKDITIAPSDIYQPSSIKDMEVVEIEKKAYFNFPLTEEAKTRIAQDNSLLDADSLATVRYTIPIKATSIQYLGLINGVPTVLASLESAGNVCMIKLDLQENDVLKVYNDEKGLLTFGTPNTTEYTVTRTGKYTIYVNNEYKLYEVHEEDLPYSSYTLKVNDEPSEIISNPDETQFASWIVTLKVGDVVTVFGDETQLGNYTVVDAGEHTFGINKKHELKIVSPSLEKVTINYYNSENWENVNVYAWCDEGALPSWPGQSMTAIGEGWYSLVVSAKSLDGLMIIFNTTGSQTNDILCPTNAAELYYYGLGTSYYSSKVDVENHINAKTAALADANARYLVGSFNSWSAKDPMYIFVKDVNNEDLYVLNNVTLKQGDDLKFNDNNESAGWYGESLVNPTWIYSLNGENLMIKETGIYTFVYSVSSNKITITSNSHQHKYYDIKNYDTLISETENTYYKSCICGDVHDSETFKHTPNSTWYLAGSMEGWTGNNSDYNFNEVSANELDIYVSLKPNDEFKIKNINGWDDAIGYDKSKVTFEDSQFGDKNSNLICKIAGVYKITLTLTDNVITAVKISLVG